MKKILLLALLFWVGCINAQFKYGIYGGFNFPGISSDAQNVRDLPIDKGGVNFMLGAHVNYEILKDIDLESGLYLSQKGYTYETADTWGITYDNYNKISALTIPVTVLFYFVGKDDYGTRMEDFRLGAGVGVYGSYALGVKITDEDGNSTIGTFTNSNRFDYGGRVMLKTLFGHFEGFFALEFGLRNNVKNEIITIKQNALLMGIGYQF